MKIDEILKVLRIFIDESLRLKVQLIEFLKFIEKSIICCLDLNIFEEEEIKSFLKHTSEVILNHYMKLKDFNDRLRRFINNNELVYNFIRENKFDVSLMKTSISFQIEFFDLLSKDKIEISKLKENTEFIEILENEKYALLEFRELVFNRLNNLTKCCVCNNFGEDKIGLYTCNNCGKNFCSFHIFASDLCEKCSKEFIERLTNRM